LGVNYFEFEFEEAGALRVGANGECGPLFRAVKRSGAFPPNMPAVLRAVLRVIVSPPAEAPALLRHGPSGYQPPPLVLNPGELELELIQTQMAQKPMLRLEEYVYPQTEPPALCRHGPSGYQPLLLVLNPDGGWWCAPRTITKIY
jgi:hypothetical protein